MLRSYIVPVQVLHNFNSICVIEVSAFIVPKFAVDWMTNEQPMNVHILTVLLPLIGLTEPHVEIDGELSFDMQILNDADKSEHDTKQINETRSKELEYQVLRGGRVTAGTVLECEYQFPEHNQLEALLSDMMNQLTKIFVRAKEFGQNEERQFVKRFRVVGKQDSGEFENAFKHMTREYKAFYKTTLNKLNNTGDPCLQQPQIKQTWSALLSRSQDVLRDAAEKSVKRVVKRASFDSARSRQHLTTLLTELLAEVRSQQLDALCDRFQLCYNDLLKQ